MQPEKRSEQSPNSEAKRIRNRYLALLNRLKTIGESIKTNDLEELNRALRHRMIADVLGGENTDTYLGYVAVSRGLQEKSLIQEDLMRAFDLPPQGLAAIYATKTPKRFAAFYQRPSDAAMRAANALVKWHEDWKNMEAQVAGIVFDAMRTGDARILIRLAGRINAVSGRNRAELQNLFKMRLGGKDHTLFEVLEILKDFGSPQKDQDLIRCWFKHGGNQTALAEACGVERQTIHKKLKRIRKETGLD